MGSASGIEPSEALRQAFGEAAADAGGDAAAVRLFVARIEDNVVVEVERRAPAGDWHSDLAMVPTLLTEKDAAYVLFRADKGWLLMAHVPDKCKVRDKMLYASSRNALKQKLGSMHIAAEMQGTLPADFGVDGYDAWKAHQDADDPLTRAEIERQQELEEGEIYRGGASMYVHGVAFAAAAGVADALRGIAGGAHNYVALGVDTEREQIVLVGAKSLASVEDMRAEVPASEPRFHFYRYARDIRGQHYDEVVFVYTCPDGSGGTKSCPIKQRMLYSSSKARVVALLADNGGEVAKTFEFNAADEIVADDIDNAMHPPPVVDLKKFQKPKRPGQGGRRIIKAGRAE